MNQKNSKDNLHLIRFSEINQELKELKERKEKQSSIKEMIIEITGEGEGYRGIVKRYKNKNPEQIEKVIVIPESSSHQVIKVTNSERSGNSPIYQKPMHHGLHSIQPAFHTDEQRSGKYDNLTYNYYLKRENSKKSQSKNRKVVTLHQKCKRPLTPLIQNKSPYIKQKIFSDGLGLNFDESCSTKPIDLVSNAHFSDQQSTPQGPHQYTYECRNNIFPLKKNSIMFEIYRKYSKRLSDYILKNHNSIRLYGNIKYTNKDPIYYLKNKKDINDIKENDKETTRVVTGSFVTKDAGKDILHKYQMYIKERGGRVDLTPLPSKSRKRMKNKVEKEEFYEVERSVVSMRRFEYNKRIKLRYLYSQESKTKYIPKIKYIQRWWRELLHRRFLLYQIIKIQSVFRGYLVRKRFNQEIQNNMADIVLTSLESFIKLKVKTLYFWKFRHYFKRIISLPKEYKISHNLKQKTIKSTIVPYKEIILIQSFIRMYLLRIKIRRLKVKKSRNIIKQFPLNAQQQSHWINKEVFADCLSYIVYIQRKWRYYIKLSREKKSERNVIFKKPLVSSTNSTITEKIIVFANKSYTKRPLIDASLFTKQIIKEKILLHIKSTETFFHKVIKINNFLCSIKIIQIQRHWRYYIIRKKRRKNIVVHTNNERLEQSYMIKEIKKSDAQSLLKIIYIQIHWKKILEAKLRQKKNEVIRNKAKAIDDQSFCYISKDQKRNSKNILHSIMTIQSYWKYKYNLTQKRDQLKPISYLKNNASTIQTKQIKQDQSNSLLKLVYIQKWWKRTTALMRMKKKTNFYSKPKISKANGFYSRIYKDKDESIILSLPKSIPYFGTKRTLNKAYAVNCIKRLQIKIIEFLSRKDINTIYKINKDKYVNDVSYCSKILIQPSKEVQKKVVLLPEIRNKQIKVNKDEEIKTIQAKWKSTNQRKKPLQDEVTRVNKFLFENCYISKERKYKYSNEQVFEKSTLQSICYLSKQDIEIEEEFTQKPALDAICYISKEFKEKESEVEIFIRHINSKDSSYIISKETIANKTNEIKQVHLIQNNYRSYSKIGKSKNNEVVIRKPIQNNSCLFSKEQNSRIILKKPILKLSFIEKDRSNLPKQLMKIKRIQETIREYIVISKLNRNNNNIHPVIIPKYLNPSLNTKKNIRDVTTAVDKIIFAIRYYINKKKKMIQKKKLTTNVMTKICKTNYDTYRLNIIKESLSSIEVVNPIKKTPIVLLKGYNGKERKRCYLWNIIKLQTIWKQFLNNMTVIKPPKINICEINKLILINNNSQVNLIKKEVKHYINRRHNKQNVIRIINKDLQWNTITKNKIVFNQDDVILIQRSIRSWILNTRKKNKNKLRQLPWKEIQTNTIVITKTNKTGINEDDIILIQRTIRNWVLNNQKTKKTEPQILMKELKADTITKIRKTEINDDITFIQRLIRNWIFNNKQNKNKNRPIQILNNNIKDNAITKTRKTEFNEADIMLVQRLIRKWIVYNLQKQNKDEPIRRIERDSKNNFISSNRKTAINENDIIFIQRMIKLWISSNKERNKQIPIIIPKSLCHCIKTRHTHNLKSIKLIQKRVKLFLKTIDKTSIPLQKIKLKSCYIEKVKRDNSIGFVLYIQRKYKPFITLKKQAIIMRPFRENCYISKDVSYNINKEDMFKVIYIEQSSKNFLRSKKNLINDPIPIVKKDTTNTDTHCIILKTRKNDKIPSIEYIQRTIKYYLLQKINKNAEVVIKKLKSDNCYLSKEIIIDENQKINYIQNNYRVKGKNNKHLDNIIVKPILEMQTKITKQIKKDDYLIDILLIQRNVRKRIELKKNTNLRMRQKIPRRRKCLLSKESHNNEIESIILLQKITRRWVRNKIQMGDQNHLSKKPRCKTNCNITKQRPGNNLQHILIIQRMFRMLLNKIKIIKPHLTTCFSDKIRFKNQLSKVITIQKSYKKCCLNNRIIDQKKPIFIPNNHSCSTVMSKKKQNAIPKDKVILLQRNIRLFLTKQLNSQNKIYKMNPFNQSTYITKNKKGYNLGVKIARLQFAIRRFLLLRKKPIGKPIISLYFYNSKQYVEPFLSKPVGSISYISKNNIESSLIRPLLPLEYISKRNKNNIQRELLRPIIHISFISKEKVIPKKPISRHFIAFLFTHIANANNEYTITTLKEANEKDIANINLSNLFHNYLKYEMRKAIFIAQKRKKIFYFIHLLKQRIIKNNQEFFFEKLQTSTECYNSFDSQLNNINYTKAKESFYFQTLRRHLLLNTDKENNTPEANVILKKVRDHLKEAVPLFFVKYFNKKIIPKITPEQRNILEATNIFQPNEIEELAFYINFCFKKEKKIQNSKRDLIYSRLKREPLTNTNIFGITRVMDHLFKNLLKVTYCPQCYCKEKEICQQKCYCHLEEEPDIEVDDQIVQVKEMPVKNQEVYCFEYDNEDNRQNKIIIDVSLIEKGESSEEDYNVLDTIKRPNRKKDVDKYIEKVKNSSINMRTTTENDFSEKQFMSSMKDSKTPSNENIRGEINYRAKLREIANQKNKSDFIILRDNIEKEEKYF